MTKKFEPKAVKVKRSNAGLGLFAAEDIQKGDFIIEYTGERITDEEADRRGGRYLFEVNSKWTIDGKGRENTARYVNHACKPNAEPREVKGRVKVYAIKNIKDGEEITYNYGKEYFDDFLSNGRCRCESCAKTAAKPKAHKN